MFGEKLDRRSGPVAQDGQRVEPRHSYENTSTPSVDVVPDDWRQRRIWRRHRAALWAWRTAYLEAEESGADVKPPRIDLCGKAGFKRGSVDLVDSGDALKVKQRASCGDIWACPVCSAVIRKGREADINEGVRRHLKAGGGVLMATFTVSHGAVDALAELLALLRDAFATMANRKAFRDLMAEYGVIGRVRALEVTYGANGWHPHFHVLMLTDGKLGAEEVAAFRDALFALWQRYTAQFGGSINSHGLDVQAARNAEAVGRYISKELVNAADAKTGNGSVTPFELLDGDTPRNRALWAEYVRAMKGKRAIIWSRGLRDRLGLGLERSDRELAEAEQTSAPGDVVMGRVARATWNRNRHNGALHDAVLGAVRAGDYYAAAALLGCSWEFRQGPDGKPWPYFFDGVPLG